MKFLLFAFLFPFVVLAKSLTVALYEDHEHYFVHSKAYKANWSLLREAAALEGITLNAMPFLWVRALDELKKGNIDAVIGAYYTVERDKLYYFSKPFSVDSIYFYRSANIPIELVKPLTNNALVGVTAGSIGEYLSEKQNNFLIYTKASSEEVFNLLQNGKLDYAIFASSVANKHCSLAVVKTVNRDCLVPVGSALDNNGFHTIYSKNAENKNIQERIDLAVEQLISQGKAKNIYMESGYSSQEYLDWLAQRRNWVGSN